MIDLQPFPEEQSLDMPSLNHSLVQARLVRLIDESRFVPLTELTLDLAPHTNKMTESMLNSLGTSRELKPDICLYDARDTTIDIIDVGESDDLVKVAKEPLLAIEILSPSQGTREIFAKFRAYFAMGVKSCWLVDPAMKVIDVFSTPTESNIYDLSDGQVTDKTLNIQLPMLKIFGKRVVAG
jgi:Uma2 family endonuclease